MPKFAVVASVIGLVLTSAAAPAQAADQTLTVAYTCSGGPFGNTTLSVPIVVPDTASGSFEARWSIPALTLRAAATSTTQVQVNGELAVTGGTHSGLPKPGASVTAGSTTTPAGQVTSTVQITAATGGQVVVKPSTETGSLKLALAVNPAEVTTCTTTGTQSVTVTVGQGGGEDPGDDTDDGTGDVVAYTCRPASGATQSVRIRTTLTLPTANPGVGEQFTIGWKGTYESGAELEAPNGLPTTGLKMYAYASISGLPGLTSATGVGELSGVAVGQPITLPTSVDMKTTSRQAGTATVKPASVNFGLRPTEPLIECEPTASGSLRTYPLTIGAGSASPSASPTRTAVVTETPTEETEEPRTSITPREGVATGAGGDAGPDGRMVILAGTVLLLAAAAGGLFLRRRPRPLG
ncbi:hypothetical protein OUY22_31905 [Nonomuraea sp. MCN248]|uniref:LPXTG cell wall anchor domain-containing protein n=1 Tax=Nonomuraea corallina TaxID=2989783 RepID=A0ABT4SLC6_9ACTN|nr:hypothetical protein [Nonomuraea corallina]MDA0638037.1 hypothetical protein [Nonomuraea corallina]